MRDRSGLFLLCVLVGSLGALAFQWSFQQLLHAWVHTEEFSYGILIPPLAAHLLWIRRKKVQSMKASAWLPGLLLVLIGCALQVVATLSGVLLVSGVALVTTLLGLIGFLAGKGRLKIALGPVMLLILMVPLPAYVIGGLSWRLQSLASTVAGRALDTLGVPVYQDGNLLKLSNYVLEVKEACSGSRSVFALLALACILALSIQGRFWARPPLILAAPILALAANVVRIVGTGLIARRWGNIAASESLHAAWGVLVFLMATAGLFGLQKALRGSPCERA
jgi:exosortase